MIDLKKKSIIIILVCAIVLILAGIIFISVSDNGGLSNYKISKTLTNKSQNLLNSHCLNELCVESMNITYNKGEGEIKFVLKNTGQNVVQGNYLKLVFDNNQDLSYVYRYDAINVLNSVNVVIEFQEKELIDASDYEIKELSTVELNEIKYGEKGNKESE